MQLDPASVGTTGTFITSLSFYFLTLKQIPVMRELPLQSGNEGCGLNTESVVPCEDLRKHLTNVSGRTSHKSNPVQTVANTHDGIAKLLKVYLEPLLILTFGHAFILVCSFCFGTGSLYIVLVVLKFAM